MFGDLCRWFWNLLEGRSAYLDQLELWKSIQLDIELFEHEEDCQIKTEIYICDNCETRYKAKWKFLGMEWE